MKLFFICPEMNGNGGTEKVVRAVANHFALKYDVNLVLTSVPENKQWAMSISPNVNVRPVHHDGQIFKVMNLLRVLIHAEDQDKVVVLGANLVKYVYYLRKFFRKNWKIISWIHYSLNHQQLFDPHNLLFADEHWAISSSIEKQLIDLGVNKKKIHLIFNPVARYSGQLNHPFPDGIHLVYVGRILFHGQKNLKELLSVVIQLAQKNSVHLDLYGTGPDLDICKRFAKRNSISSCLSWHGWVQNPWQEILEKVHPQALVLCSKYEGLPMVMLEAMSRGIPCISADFDGYDDVLLEGTNGFSYHLGDVIQFSKVCKKFSSVNFDPSVVSNSILSLIHI